MGSLEIFPLLWIFNITDNNLTVKCKLCHDIINLTSEMFLFISEKPTRKRKRIGRFLNRVWTAVKGFFCCCCHSCAVDVVEPFLPTADLEPEPDPDPSSPDPSSPDPDPSSPDPDPSSAAQYLCDVEPNNGKSPVLISPTLF